MNEERVPFRFELLVERAANCGAPIHSSRSLVLSLPLDRPYYVACILCSHHSITVPTRTLSSTLRR
jgi:hypothetical protein